MINRMRIRRKRRMRRRNARAWQELVYEIIEDANLRAALRGELRAPHGRRVPDDRRVSLRVAQELRSSSGERVRASSLPRLPTKRSST
jgi:hypothetical protein